MISDEILAGRFRVGDRLPAEREFAETFGVSRNVIREAMARLRFEGAVEPRHGAGVFVLGSQVHNALRIDAEILRDRALFANLFELRAILEVEAAGLAATRRSLKQLNAISDALQTLYDSQDSGLSVEADLEFHRAIARASDNVYVATFVNFISQHVRTSIATADARIDVATRARINKEEHAAIYEAIRDMDAKLARESMKRHVAQAMERLGISSRPRRRTAAMYPFVQTTRPRDCDE